ncbi:centrosomal protein of 164 kDa-like [Arapaima gigas]
MFSIPAHWLSSTCRFWVKQAVLFLSCFAAWTKQKIYYFNFSKLKSTVVHPSKKYYQELAVQEQSCGLPCNKKGMKVKEKKGKKGQSDKNSFSNPAPVHSAVESLQAPTGPLPPLRSLPPLQSLSPLQSQLAMQSLPPLQSPWGEKFVTPPSHHGLSCSSAALDPLKTALKAPDSSQRCSPVGLSQEDCVSPSLSKFVDVEDKFSKEEVGSYASGKCLLSDSETSEVASWLERMKPEVQAIEASEVAPLDKMETELEVVALPANHNPVPHSQLVAPALGPLLPLRSLPPLPTLWGDAHFPSHHGSRCGSEVLESPGTPLNVSDVHLLLQMGSALMADAEHLSLTLPFQGGKAIKARGVSPGEKIESELQELQEVMLSVNHSTELPSQDFAHSWPQTAVEMGSVSQGKGLQFAKGHLAWNPFPASEEQLRLEQETETQITAERDKELQESQWSLHKNLRKQEEEVEILQKEKENRVQEENKGQLKELRAVTEAEWKVEKGKLEERRKADLEALRQENKDLLEAERHRLQREREEHVEALRSELGGLLQKVRQEVQGEHKQMLEVLKEEHHRELKSIRENHLVEREKLLSVVQEERRRLLAAHSSHQEDLHVQLELKLQKMCQEQILKEAELKEQGQQLELKSKELKAQTAALHAQVEDLKLIRQRLGDEAKEMQREKEMFSCLLQERDGAQVERSHFWEEVERVRKERDQAREEGWRLREEKLSSRLENKVKFLQDHLEQLNQNIGSLKCSESIKQPVNKSHQSNTETHSSRGSQPTLAAELQQLTEFVQYLSGQLNSMLGALDCLAQRQAPVLPLAQPSYTSLPSPVHHSVCHGVSCVSGPPAPSKNLKEMLSSQWNKILPDRHVENTVMDSAYSGHTPARELSRCLFSTLPKLAEVDSQRVQDLIESNKRWLEGHRRDSSMSALSQMKNPPYIGRLVQFSLDEKNEIIVHHF